jgi:hypothetical protein
VPLPPSDPGLCRDCRHARLLTSDKGSQFWQCQRSFSDPSFPKYPRLPVRDCRGYETKAEAPDSNLPDSDPKDK